MWAHLTTFADWTMLLIGSCNATTYGCSCGISLGILSPLASAGRAADCAPNCPYASAIGGNHDHRAEEKRSQMPLVCGLLVLVRE